MPLLDPGLLQLTLEPIERGWCVVPARLLFEHYATFVERQMVFFLHVPRQDAVDVARNVFVRVLRTDDKGFRPTSLLPKRTPKSWLIQLAKEEAANYFKTDGRARRVFDKGATPADDRASDDVSASQRFLRAQILERWQEHAASFDPELLEIFILMDLEGFSRTEVAELLGKRPGTVASQIKEARQKLAPFFARMRSELPPLRPAPATTKPS